ncbi:2-dehydropantoate 2-reductase [[Candida] anglica]|uniref:2-dehydropantoate 2-reductase n=1 Tax=[Candida] anglica TaxID=148631 RepID=A0ABP0EAD5_9ASCO
MTKFHFLGVGSMGSLVAHELAKANPIAQKEITLLFKNNPTVDSFKHHDSRITVNTVTNSDISTASSQLLGAHHIQPSEPLENLVISTKAYQTEDALRRYIPNIQPSTNLILLQNGMGMWEHLLSVYWPYEANRPNIYQCISTHGAYKSAPFTCNHVGLGKLDIAKVEPHQAKYKKRKSNTTAAPLSDPPEIIRLLLDTPALNTSYMDFPNLLLKQIEKLVVNACINPLTAIFDCQNGDLLYTATLPKLMTKVIREAILVFKLEYPQLQSLPEAEVILNEDRLLNSVLQVCKLTAKNSSSMREDVRLLKPTEIYWINGFISRLGQKHRIPTNTNNLLQEMLSTKLSISRVQEDQSLNLVLDTVNQYIK